MKRMNYKSLAILVCISMLASFTGCGKDSSTEESLQAELESLRAQLETQETAETEEDEEIEETDSIEETETVEETVEETEPTEEETTYPFTINKTGTNLAIGEIAEYGDFCVGLAGVRMLYEYESFLEGTYYDNYIPYLPDGQVAIHPIIQIYNASDEVQEYDDEIVSVYVDNVQVTPVDAMYTDSYWVDGLQELIFTDLDAGESSVIITAFNVDENWSNLTVFYGDISWTVSREEVMTEPYVYTSMFNQGEVAVTEPGTTIYKNNEYEVVFDGVETYSEGFRCTFILFEFTINNLTDSMIQIDFPSNVRAYYEHRLLEDPSTSIEDPVNGYNNLFQDYWNVAVEIHPGMSSKIFISYVINEETGAFECYFETADEGVVGVAGATL